MSYVACLRHGTGEDRSCSPVNIEPKIRFSHELSRSELDWIIEGEIKHISNVGPSRKGFELLLSHVGVLAGGESGEDELRLEEEQRASTRYEPLR